MEKKDRNAKPGDSEIVTKKGFLISLPGKKNNTPKNENKISEAKITNAVDHKNDRPQQKKEQNSEQKSYFQNAKKQNGGQKNFRRNNQKHKKGGQKREDSEILRAKEMDAEINNAIIEHEEREKDKKNAGQNDLGDKNRRFDRDRRRNGRKPEANADRKNDGEKTENPAQQNVQNNQNSQNNQNGGKQKNQQNRNSQNNQNGGKQKNRRDQKQEEKKPSILEDLGYSSSTFAKHSANIFSEEKADDEEEAPKIDYSKAIPLRDQIYAPKKTKLPISEQDKTDKTEVIGVRFKEAGKIYYFDPDSREVPFGTPVIVETARGLEYGYTAISNRLVPTGDIVAPLKKIIRLATKEDKDRLDANKVLEQQAVSIFEEKVAKLKLEMTLVGVEYTFDNTKLIFYFAAEGRVDFRELVKELASVFRTRIELRQVGVRDEAKLIGGYGVCGRPLCCKSFLGEFAQVSIKMAKDQSLSLNSAKISGACGRLLCCLRYEDEVYEQEYERTPKVDAIVETPEGKGVVVETNPLKGIVKVRLDAKKDSPAQPFHRDTVKILGYIHRKDSEEEDLKELEKE